MKAIVDDLPNDIERLKKMRHFKKSTILSNNNRLMYSNRNIQKQENPLPDGYRKEKIKLDNKEYQAMIDRIDQKLIVLNIQNLQEHIK